MYIKELHLKNFGKFKDKIVKLENGINVIYGENEAGKSTLHTFIRGMFFGIEKQRGKTKKMDNYDKYEPWEGRAFYEGSMRFCVDGKSFLLERNFYRKEKRVRFVNELDLEELSVEQGDLSVILGGLNEAGYANTISIGQMAWETEKGLLELIQNHMENYEKTGDMDFNYARAVARLKEQKKQMDKAIKGALEEKEQKQMEFCKEEERYRQEKAEKEAKIKEIRSNIIEPEPISVVPLKQTSKQKREENQKENQKENKIEKKFIRKVGGIILAFMLFAIAWSFSDVRILAGGLGGIVLLITFWKRNEQLASETECFEEEDQRKKEAHVLYQDEQMLRQEAQVRYQKQLWTIERLEEEIQELKTCQENIIEVINEQAIYPKEVIKLRHEIDAINLALDTLEGLSQGLHKERAEELNEKISHILSTLTNGKYDQVVFDENLKLNIWSEGKKLEVDQVSQGTLEQVYFAMRMSGAQFLYETETLPLILDEAFAMYDEKRLGAALKWLSKQPSQVLLFTCHKREIEILESLKIPFYKECL